MLKYPSSFFSSFVGVLRAFENRDNGRKKLALIWENMLKEKSFSIQNGMEKIFFCIFSICSCFTERIKSSLRAHLHIATKIPSSTFHRSFIEFFVVMHEIFYDGINFLWKIPFAIFLKKIKLIKKGHRSFIDLYRIFVHDHEKFDEASMKRR